MTQRSWIYLGITLGIGLEGARVGRQLRFGLLATPGCTPAGR